MLNERLSAPSKWAIPVAAIGGLLLVILYSLGAIGGPDKVAPGNTAAPSLPIPEHARTLTVGKQWTGNTLSWPGTVRSRTLVKIAPKLNARITDITVHAGDAVKQGRILVKLDNRDALARRQEALAALAAAKAMAAQANADEQRIAELYHKEAATRQDFDAAIARAKTARAGVNQAQSTAQQIDVLLNDNVLIAPFDGVVVERLQEPGAMGLANEPIVALQKPNDLRLEAALPSQCLVALKPGMPATVRSESPSQSIEGRVDEIVPDIDAATRTQTVKIALPANSGLQVGQFAWLQQNCDGRQQTLLIPADAILRYGQLEAVRVAVNQQLYTRHIRTGKRQGEQVEVLSGLHEGETILLNDEPAP